MNNNILSILRKNITRNRKRFGCSCKQLSELIGCDSSYISKVENGRIIPPVDKLIAIANYFEMHFVDLFKE